MVGLPYDCLANPLGAVRLTFEKAVASGSDPASLNGKDWGAVDLFREFLFDQGGLAEVPLLNASSVRYLQTNTLVRFRGMIQDMLGNEFYVGAYKDGSIWRTNKFADVAQFPMGSSPNDGIWERRLLYCVPVPGQNSWTEFPSRTVINQSTQREKRCRMDDDAVDHMDMLASDEGCQSSPSTKKMREDGHPTSQSESMTEDTCPIMSVMPNVEKDLLPCLVKIYDSPESELKLNDVFEFVGVFTFDKEQADKDDCGEPSDDFSEDVLDHLPPNKVPRIHCLVHQKIGAQDFLHSSPIAEPKPHLVKEIRESLLRHLTTVLGNDGVAAHYLLLHLLSRVHARVDPFAVGKLTLNLTSLNKENVSVFGNRLNLAVKDLVPYTHSIPLTVEYLNSATLAPKKDYETNRLIAGALQVAEGSNLIIDETQLESGTLNSTGVENVRLLKNLMELQKVEYDFTYYKMEMATDVQVIVLSEGKSNILPADLVIPFNPSAVESSEVPTTETLEAWRWYLATLRSLPHSIDSEMQKVLENDLVAARQADRNLGSQDFSRWLTMGRLVSLSFGESCLTMEHWQMVKELERLRSERLQ